MQSLLVDFLNHGIFPFVGRSAELERIDAFWRTAAEAYELRAALLIGEAGIGKSRLIEELMPRIVREGGAVVHTRLYPDSTSSITSLVARALRLLSNRRRLQIGEPGETVPSVALAMRRLARLRPVMLIIEDLHLLKGSSLREFSLLMEALADEPIAFLAAARPTELPARAVLERYFVEEIEVKGLSEDHLAELWGALFSTPAGAELLRPLQSATLGNPLALRSALRGAIRAGSLAHDVTTDNWKIRTGAREFGRTLKKNVELLSEGMAAHLTPEEKEAAALLASLGEVFAREAAEKILAGRTSLVESLIFKGIIASATTHSAPLLGEEPEQFPLAFSHTLVHRSFVEQGAAAGLPLVDILASDLPIYSVLPLQILQRAPIDAPIPLQTRRAAITRALSCAISLDRGTDWPLAVIAVDAAWLLAESDDWEGKEGTEIRLRVMRSRLSALRRDVDTPTYRELVNAFYALSSDADPDLASFRIMAHMYLIRRFRRSPDVEEYMEIWRSVGAIIERFPHLRFTSAYLAFLQAPLIESPTCAAAMMPLVEREVETILAGVPPDHPIANEVKTLIYPYFLTSYTTLEQLAERERMLEEMDRLTSLYEPTITIQKIRFLIEAGHIAEAESIATASRPWFRDLGLMRNAVNCAIFQVCAEFLRGIPGDEAIARIRRILTDAPQQLRPELDQIVVSHFSNIGLIAGDRGWTLELRRAFGAPFEEAQPIAMIMLATGAERAAALRAVMEDTTTAETHRELAAILLDPGPDPERIIPALREFLGGPILSLHGIAPFMATFDMLAWARETAGLERVVAELTADVQGAAERLLSWWAAHSLPMPMLLFLGRTDIAWEPKRLQHWRRVAAELMEHRAPCRAASGGEKRQRLTMLGTIELHNPDGETIAIRGSRLRALLGLLVADQMLDKPLSHREMAAILSGADDDPDKARKTLNGVVFRLREAIGNDAILTDRDTPRLNTDLLDVDLLDAHAALRESTAALDERSLGRAATALLRAATIAMGEVAFPTLYENFFEALREDFENELRSAIMRATRGLLDEGDPQSAEGLLRLGMKGMPGDEEIAELLREALLALGKRAEAERVRLGAAMEEP
jgi:DNA-binding SARP family transcriptional activator